MHHHLNVEEASRFAVTATVADLEDWSHTIAVHGQIELADLLDALQMLRSTSHPQHQSTPTLTSRSAS
jgi:hypothetical protein